MRKEPIEERCEPFMYNTQDDLLQFEIGDIVEVKFGNENYRVKKEYVGRKLKFIVSNLLEYEWRLKTKRLALVPIEKEEDFKTKDVLFLDAYDRFECLMIDLFPVNRRPYAGWKNKTVQIKKITS